MLAEPQRAKWQTEGFSDAAAGEAADLQAASAEIEQDAIRHAQPPDRSSKSQSRLRKPSENLDAHAELALDTLGEADAVARIAHRGGRHGDDACGARAIGKRQKVAERLHRARHRGLAELGLLIDVVNEAQWSTCAGKQPKMVRRITLEHHDAPGIGADIDDRDRVSARRTSTLRHLRTIPRAVAVNPSAYRQRYCARPPRME